MLGSTSGWLKTSWTSSEGMSQTSSTTYKTFISPLCSKLPLFFLVVFMLFSFGQFLNFTTDSTTFSKCRNLNIITKCLFILIYLEEFFESKIIFSEAQYNLKCMWCIWMCSIIIILQLQEQGTSIYTMVKEILDSNSENVINDCSCDFTKAILCLIAK